MTYMSTTSFPTCLSIFFLPPSIPPSLLNLPPSLPPSFPPSLPPYHPPSLPPSYLSSFLPPSISSFFSFTSLSPFYIPPLSLPSSPIPACLPPIQFENEDVRVFLVNMYSNHARSILCQVRTSPSVQANDLLHLHTSVSVQRTYGGVFAPPI